MKYRTSKAAIFVAALILPTSLFALSGMGDRMESQLLNLSALATVVLLTELVLGWMYRFSFSDSGYAHWINRAGESLSKKKYLGIFAFWLLFSFAAAPYTGTLATLSLGIIYVLLLLGGLICILWPKIRRNLTGAKSVSRWLNLSIMQLAGFGIYGLVYRLESFKKVFFIDNGEIPELGFVSYADGQAYAYAAETWAISLLILLLPIVLYAIGDFIGWGFLKIRNVGKK